MPRTTAEKKEERKNEIIDACAEIYREKGFHGVTLKEISTQTSFTRPAIYTYFETKDEILLALLDREYESWIKDLKSIASIHTKLTRRQLSEEIAHSLEKRDLMLRIQNMNLFEIELNSRVERLAEFKKLYGESRNTISAILKKQAGPVSDQEVKSICLVFESFLFGVYPFVVHTDKQLEAMKMAGVENNEISIYQMTYECIIRLLPPDGDEERGD